MTREMKRVILGGLFFSLGAVDGLPVLKIEGEAPQESLTSSRRNQQPTRKRTAARRFSPVSKRRPSRGQISILGAGGHERLEPVTDDLVLVDLGDQSDDATPPSTLGGNAVVRHSFQLCNETGSFIHQYSSGEFACSNEWTGFGPNGAAWVLCSEPNRTKSPWLKTCYAPTKYKWGDRERLVPASHMKVSNDAAWLTVDKPWPLNGLRDADDASTTFRAQKNPLYVNSADPLSDLEPHQIPVNIIALTVDNELTFGPKMNP